jgi:hypothetical protein
VPPATWPADLFDTVDRLPVDASTGRPALTNGEHFRDE